VPPIGAHIQIRGGLAKGGLAYTDAVAARAVQVFVGNPRGWKLTTGDVR
jgi:deoxyribonuclease IV